MTLPLVRKNLREEELCGILAVFVATCSCSIDGEPKGWLDRVVQYHRDKFVDELNELPKPTLDDSANADGEAINNGFVFRGRVSMATLGKAGPNFQDSDAWDFESVMRLLELIDRSPATQELKKKLLVLLTPKTASGRRYIMDPYLSLSKIPSIAAHHPGFFYDSIESEFISKPMPSLSRMRLSDDDVVFIQNPIESRMPASRITVRVLKDIMMNRAKNNRIMPTKYVPEPFTWKYLEPKPVPPIENGGDAGGGDAGADGGGTTPGGAAGGGGEGEGGGENPGG